MPAGRPSTYDPAYVEQARKLAKLGATDRDLADFFECSISTIFKWRAEHPEFSEATKVGKDEADNAVQQSLYRRATGYSHDAVKIITVSQGANAGAEVQEIPYTEHYPPDTTAAIFWLKNRRPAEWRDRQEVTGKDGAALIPDGQLDNGKAALALLNQIAGALTSAKG